jgi:hypothetical protein
MSLDSLSAMILAQMLAHSEIARTGISLGSVIAVVCSWQRHRSVLWAILAGLLSWFYVVYFIITRKPSETNRLP